MNDTLDDIQLIKRIQKGDIKAYELLIQKYQQRIFNFVYRIVYEEYIAEEITQDTFFRVYTIIDKVDLQKKFSSFIFEIAKNKAIDYIKRKKKTVSIEELEIIDDDLSLEESFIQEETKAEIMKALDRLSKQYKDIILLYYQQDLSYEEISKKLSLPLNTVRTHLRRAKEQLKGVLS